MKALDIYKSDGTLVARGAALESGATYYCEMPAGDFECARLASFLFKYDATLVINTAITFEVSNRLGLASYAAAANGWTAAPTSNPATLAISASAGVAIRYAADVGAGRIRAVIPVTTGGVLEIDGHTKGD